MALLPPKKTTGGPAEPAGPGASGQLTTGASGGLPATGGTQGKPTQAVQGRPGAGVPAGPGREPPAGRNGISSPGPAPSAADTAATPSEPHPASATRQPAGNAGSAVGRNPASEKSAAELNARTGETSAMRTLAERLASQISQTAGGPANTNEAPRSEGHPSPFSGSSSVNRLAGGEENAKVSGSNRAPTLPSSPFASRNGAPEPSQPAASAHSRIAASSLPGSSSVSAGGKPLPAISSLIGASAMPGMEAPAASRGVRISHEEFLQLRDFIYEKCGIYIAENRKYLIENRLANRLKDLNLKTFGEYYYYLKFDSGKLAELPRMYEVITTNETSFYRNPPQLKVFQQAVLTAELDKMRRAGQKKLRIWSAGCSTGEEPYTLAMIIHEVLKGDVANWDIKITANDLSEAVLESARRGLYTDYALRTTPPEIIGRYFLKEGGLYRIDPKLKQMISFGMINLSERATLKRVERSHIIFCRNVIIYFDDEMKKQIISSFYDNLLPGGCMLIGHSESLHNISRAFKPEHHTGTIVYRKLP